MEKPVIYIMVENGLVENVYVKAPFGANTKVVICDFDATEEEAIKENQKTLVRAQETAHLVY